MIVEEAMRIATVILAALVSTALVGTAAAQEEGVFIKRPKVLGKKESTVTTYQARKGDENSPGSFIDCSGRCPNDAATRYWKCKGTHVDVTCSLRCRPPPPKAGCLGL